MGDAAGLCADVTMSSELGLRRSASEVKKNEIAT